MELISVAGELDKHGRTSTIRKRQRSSEPRNGTVQENQEKETKVDQNVEGEGSLPFTLTNPKLFDCAMCLQPLSVPVFQCDNEHTACSFCLEKLANKRSSCSLTFGSNQCFFIEKVLESINISCPNMKYGCKETVSYIKKNDHDKACIYAPCSCPQLPYNFISSSKQVYQHHSSNHAVLATPFKFGFPLPIFFTITEKALVIQERGGAIFIGNGRKEVLGHVIMVSCLGPSSIEGSGYFFELTAKKERINLKLQLFTKNIQSRVDKPPSEGFLLVPREFFGANETSSWISAYGLMANVLQHASNDVC